MPLHQSPGGVGKAPVTNARWQRPPVKPPYRDGTTHVIFEPLDFIARLVALIPRPRVNLIGFHGVFALNSWHRALCRPAKQGKGNKAWVADEPPTPVERRVSMTWTSYLKRVFNINRDKKYGYNN